MSTAFDPISLGGRHLANRMAMAPMTRSRAYGPGATPTEAMATYYAQRAGAGLIVTEGTQPSAVGQGFPDTPGLYSPEQVDAWRKVTSAVHAANGTIFAQLMHAGRASHASLIPDGLEPLAPSPVVAQGKAYTHDGRQDFGTPRELTSAEIESTIADFASAARNAVAAGFDGVEIHGANGYLVHQFLSDNANVRSDDRGGSIEGRTRFAVEVARAVAEAIGGHRVGLRISPGNPMNDIVEANPAEHYLALVSQLEPLGLAYLHLIERHRDLTQRLRKAWPSTLILNPHTAPHPTGLDALELIDNGTTDLISFGALFLANPDLPRRLRAGGPFDSPDRATFYGGDEHGYTDYPSLRT